MNGADGRDGRGAEPLDELFAEGSGAASHIQGTLATVHARPVGEEHGERLGVAAHEAQICGSADVEAHVTTVLVQVRPISGISASA
ncbi:MAG: hypothetical protein JWQ64_1264 [Subtercola sp.]|nr:hypothetical protein [Subtercola sp.]